jgi:hypothetical protein
MHLGAICKYPNQVTLVASYRELGEVDPAASIPEPHTARWRGHSMVPASALGEITGNRPPARLRDAGRRLPPLPRRVQTAARYGAYSKSRGTLLAYQPRSKPRRSRGGRLRCLVLRCRAALASPGQRLFPVQAPPAAQTLNACI